MTRKHPYREFEGTTLWKAVNKALDDLSENGDVDERTDRALVAGYICKVLAEHGVSAESMAKVMRIARKSHEVTMQLVGALDRTGATADSPRKRAAG